MVSDAEILNKIEEKVRKGKAKDIEIRILQESYLAYDVSIPKDIQKIFGLKKANETNK